MNAEFRRVLRRLIEQRGESMVSISAKLGRSRAWLPRLIQGKRSLREEHFRELAQALEMSLEEMLAEYLRAVESPHLAIKSDQLQNPGRLLAALRGSKDPDLGWVGGFAKIPAAPLPKSARFELHPNVRRIDDLREFDRQAALVESEQWLRSFERRGRDRRLAAKETSQLSTALGVWSSLQRDLGHQFRGLRALELAWFVHGGTSVAAPSCGDLLERTSVAIRDQGFPMAGYPLMQRAYGIAELNADEFRQAKALLVLGYLAFEGGDSELAENVLDRVPGHPGADTPRVAASIGLLALISEQKGDLEKASALLRPLMSQIPELAPTLQHSLLGIHARTLHQLGDLTQARSIYEQLLKTARPLLPPIDCASVLLHLFQVLADEGAYAELSGHAGHVASLAEELEDTPLAAAVLRDLLVAIRQNQGLSAAELGRIASELRGAAKPVD